jgi:hypothetical protein
MLNIKSKIKALIITLLLLFSFSPSYVLAIDTQNAIQCGVNAAAGANCTAQPSGSVNGTIKAVINVLSVITGAAAVIMIIIGGFRYVTSGGNPETTKGARNTIIYAVIGIVVVAVSQLIVHFVLNTIK